MNMDVTKNEKALMTEAVLSYFSGWMKRDGRYNAINMLLELQRPGRGAMMAVEDAELVLRALKEYDEDTTELESKIEEALDQYYNSKENIA